MEVTSPDPRGYCKIREAAEFSGVSVRTLRNWLKDGLRHSRLKSGRILISYAAIDEYLAAHEETDNWVDRIADEITA